MRGMWAAGAAITLLVLLAAPSVIAQEPTEGPSAERVEPCAEGASTLTLTVSDLVGMEGLELSAVVGAMAGDPPELLDAVTERSPFEATASG